MLNKKSFDLKKDDKKSTERLYQPKKFRWCKYIVLPLLFGFVLLLILINVDFTGEAYNQTILQTSGDVTDEEYNLTMLSANARMNNPVGMMKETLSQIKTSFSLSRASNCISSIDSCTLTCVGGNINNIYKQLEPLYKSCNKDLDLVLIDCSLPSSRLKSDFFEGNYRLQSVNFSNCNLAAIQNKAFAQDTVKNLKNLTLSNTIFTTLDMSAFEGLQQLEHFYFNNKMTSWTLFQGQGFLQYFAESLISLTIQQESLATTTYDPLPWLQGKNMNKIISVNLANNNFQNILNSKTFSTLVAVEYLDLSNCSITYLAANVFDDVLKTLKHLDLSSNYLTTLGEEMLLQMSSLELNLAFNYWQCSCDNKEMLQIIKWNLADIVFVNRENVRCYTPIELRDVPIDDLALDCLITTTTVDISETTQNETDMTPEPTTITTVIIQSNTTTTTKMTNKPSEETTESSSEMSSSSTDSSSSSNDSSSGSSSQTSEETDTNETSQETVKTTTPLTTTPTPLNTTVTIPLPTTTKTTRKTTTTTTTAIPPNSQEKIKIYCNNTDNEIYVHDVLKEKCIFTIKPISATSVKIVSNNLLTNMAIIYFYNNKNYTIISNRQQQQHNEYFTIIKNLNSSTNYVFCLLQQLHEKDSEDSSDSEKYNWYISPFDCHSFSWPETYPEVWLDKEDEIWIISLVVLGTCLMLFMGIILVVIVVRWKKRNNKNNYTRTLVRDLEMEPNYLQPSNGLTKCNTIVVPPGRLYISRHQPPDVVAQHVNFSSNHDLYEELIM